MNKHSEYISPYADELPELLEADKPVKPQLGIDNKVRIDRTAVEKLDMIRDGLDTNSDEFEEGYDLGKKNLTEGAFWFTRAATRKINNKDFIGAEKDDSVAGRCIDILLGG